MFYVSVKKKGFHLEVGKPYLCLDIINIDKALIVGEENNITIANIYDCLFVSLVNDKECCQDTKVENQIPILEKVKVK